MEPQYVPPGLLALSYKDFVMQRLGVKIPEAPSAEALVHLAKRCMNPPFEAQNGWRTEPPFPGTSETPEKMPGDAWRMICASRVFKDDIEQGVIFMTFYSGRTVAIFIATPGTAIPAEYVPITRR